MKPTLLTHRKVAIAVAGLLLLVLSSIGLAAASFSSNGDVSHPRQSDATPVPPDAGQETLASLEDTYIPPRDRVDLAIRLLGVTDVAAPPTEPPAEYEVGDVVTFWADNLDADEQFQVDAELVYKTDHVYMFVEQGYPVDLAGIRRSADTFENEIRPEVHRVFGTEALPGIDGDPHLYILHARNLGYWVAAYYGSTSEYPDEVAPGSNEKEMFFVNLDTMGNDIGTDYYEAVLAHEFQHMVHFNVDLNEDTWVNEGLSELAPLLTGYGISDFSYSFLNAGTVQLNTWPENDNRGVHYGAAFMYIAYFYDRFGEDATIALVADAANGMDGIENALFAIDARDPLTDESVTVVDVFGDWAVANLLMDTSLGDGRYGYSLPEMTYLPAVMVNKSLSPDGSAREMSGVQWGATYIRLTPNTANQQVTLSFSGDQIVRILPTEAYSGDYLWWSNRADESDTRLTRAFDLTGVDSATLNFMTWYHIEDLWDYAYVMVSTDDGATWTPLETGRTTTEDPHSNAYGPGYTGQSGEWVPESVDLSAYAGQEIQVRFEYITDDAVTQPGMVIDDISIPEIGYSYDVENGDDGWITEGWLRTDNVLPQRFLVQLVQTGNPAAPVTRLLGEDDMPEGEWTFTLEENGGDTYLVISGLAPVTTEPTQFSVTLAAAE
ncbi:MAG: hypothetical protein GYB65_16395 [Chloroflexi bacterium]|nr:hypothetical protein [Chloroflexota bacterium]